MIARAFKAFKGINNLLEDDIAEISIKRSQIMFTFVDGTLVQFSDIMKLQTLDSKISVCDITCFNNNIYVAIRDLDENLMLSEIDNKLLKDIYNIIVVLRDNLCTCPALEYILAEGYIKVFVDLPNIQVSDLSRLNDILQQDAFLELGADRPYLLYVNEAVIE